MKKRILLITIGIFVTLGVVVSIYWDEIKPYPLGDDSIIFYDGPNLKYFMEAEELHYYLCCPEKWKKEGEPPSSTMVIEAYRKVIDNYPFLEENIDDPYHRADEAQLAIATIYFKMDNYDQAIIEAKKLIEDYPNSYLIDTALYVLGNIYHKQGKNEEALKWYKKVIKRNSFFGLFPKRISVVIKAQRQIEKIVTQK